jgi:hypothetical protein
MDYFNRSELVLFTGPTPHSTFRTKRWKSES